MKKKRSHFKYEKAIKCVPRPGEEHLAFPKWIFIEYGFSFNMQKEDRNLSFYIAPKEFYKNCDLENTDGDDIIELIAKERGFSMFHKGFQPTASRIRWDFDCDKQKNEDVFDLIIEIIEFIEAMILLTFDKKYKNGFHVMSWIQDVNEKPEIECTDQNLLYGSNLPENLDNQTSTPTMTAEPDLF